MDRSTPTKRLWAPRALLGPRDALAFASDVLLEVDAGGRWAMLKPGVTPAPSDATVLAGPVLPGLVDGHSHAFQRAFVGLAERLPEPGSDDFWSWRGRMYGVADRIDAADLRAVAAQLYLELVAGGFTEVVEFHYLHHAALGGAAPPPGALALAHVEAAAEVGIGLTLLPVLYQRAGFGRGELEPGQRRFARTPADVLAEYRLIAALAHARLHAGIAVHSLRAASAEDIHALIVAYGNYPGPIHIHAAEQIREVDDCLAATGRRPLEWLCRELPLDARWHLVHATHATPAEIDAVARTSAGVVVCPSTEANLGDGLFDLPRWLDAEVPLTLGSDSQVGRDAPGELRLLEYGQRLAQRRRNVAATPAAPITAARLFAACLGGGAAGQARWGLVPGARADALVVDLDAPGLVGVPESHLLDALVFGGSARLFRDVYVAGEPVLSAHTHPRGDVIARDFRAAMARLWGK